MLGFITSGLTLQPSIKFGLVWFIYSAIQSQRSQHFEKRDFTFGNAPHNHEM